MSLEHPESFDDAPQLWKLHLLTSEQHAKDLADELDHAALSSAWFDSNDGSKLWHFEALFDYIPDTAWLEDLTVDVPYTFKAVPIDNWIEQNQAAFPPLEIGRFYIHGSHIAPPAMPDKIVFEIDAATAFGTGEHATTQACLLLIESLHQQHPMLNNILDLGCGTGILGMAAAVVFEGSQVTLSDNDMEAVSIAQGNVVKNQSVGNLKVFLAEGFVSDDLQHQAPFDLIIANILADPLIALAPDMTKYSTKVSFLILSGLLITQAAQVIDAYADHGFTCTTQQYSGEWAALLMTKNE